MGVRLLFIDQVQIHLNVTCSIP